MLLNLIESYINDDPKHREGILLFFDMEKAFDRCSYTFLNEGLEAVGFGEKFCHKVNMMYNEERPPQRRIYANGYLGEWFDIKSGVAQGCPLSPLLFLLVAEALKMTLCNDPKIEGIKIGDIDYLISQFADDTTLGLRNEKSIPAVEDAIERWGLATGMKENAAKREGIAMGKLTQKKLPGPTKWIQKGGWARSLGYPIGNHVSHAEFWKAKLESIATIAKYWRAR